MDRKSGQLHLRTRADAKLDAARALQLHVEKHLSHRQIGALYGVTPSAVTRALRPFRQLIRRDPEVVSAYRQHEAALLDAVRLELVLNMLSEDRLAKASVNNLALAFRQVFDAGRLLRGQATGNLSLKAALVALPAEPPDPPATPTSSGQPVLIEAPDA